MKNYQLSEDEFNYMFKTINTLLEYPASEYLEDTIGEELYDDLCGVLTMLFRKTNIKSGDKINE